MRFDCPRSPAVQVLRMGFADGGEGIAMDHQAAAGWPTAAMAPALMPKDGHGVPFDPFAIHGADHWYTVGAQRARAIQNDLAQRTFRPGWLRSVGGGWIYWALETFMDEAAHDLGVDPSNVSVASAVSDSPTAHTLSDDKSRLQARAE
jgi:isoquinoline 1-oxidoreductase subunit beta